MAHIEGIGTNIDGDYHEKEEELATFEFPIIESVGTNQMKHSSLYLSKISWHPK